MQPDSPDAVVLKGVEKRAAIARGRAKWLATARPSQVPPDWNWSYFLACAGRGFGKTRAGSEETWWHAARHPAARIAMVGATAADVRDIMVEGASGILAVSPEGFRPLYEPSKRRLTWPNGAQAALYSAEEPERLRGPEHSFAWCDELGSWQNQQATWDQLQFGLRTGAHPQIIITTTPRPTKLIRALSADPRTALVTGSTFDNAANLAPSALAKLRERYANSRLGKQELEGLLLVDVEGALWVGAMIDQTRMEGPLPAMRRVVIGVDPSGSDGESGDCQGIVAAGLGVDGRGYVLEDGTDRLTPEGWARKVASLYHRHRADRVVAERNFGGAMVESTMRAVAPDLPIKLVTAARGKHVRAEPVAALYEQGRVSHAEPFPELEEQMGMFTTKGYEGGASPDRVDALVWALSELFLEDLDDFDLATFLRANSTPETEIQRALENYARSGLG